MFVEECIFKKHIFEDRLVLTHSTRNAPTPYKKKSANRFGGKPKIYEEIPVKIPLDGKGHFIIFIFFEQMFVSS